MYVSMCVSVSLHAQKKPGMYTHPTVNSIYLGNGMGREENERNAFYFIHFYIVKRFK